MVFFSVPYQGLCIKDKIKQVLVICFYALNTVHKPTVLSPIVNSANTTQYPLYSQSKSHDNRVIIIFPFKSCKMRFNFWIFLLWKTKFNFCE